MMTGSRAKSSTTTLRVKYKAGSVADFVRLAAQDISDAGMFIRTRKPVAVGTRVKLQLVLEDGSMALSGLGHVAFSRTVFAEAPMGMGVSFDDLNDASRETVQAAVAARGARTCRFDDRSHANLPEDLGTSVKPTVTGAFSGAPTTAARVASGPVAGAFSAGAFSASKNGPVSSKGAVMVPPPAALAPGPAVVVPKPSPVPRAPVPSAAERSVPEPPVPGLFANSSTASESSIPPPSRASASEHPSQGLGANTSFFPPAEAESFFGSQDIETPQAHIRDAGVTLAATLTGPDVSPATAEAARQVGQLAEAESHGLGELFDDVFEEGDSDLLEDCAPSTVPGELPALPIAAGVYGEPTEAEALGAYEEREPEEIESKLDSNSEEVCFDEVPLSLAPLEDTALLDAGPHDAQFGEAESLFPRALGDEFSLDGAEADVLARGSDAPQLDLTESELDTSRHEAVAAALQAAPRPRTRGYLWMVMVSVVGFALAFVVMSGRVPAPLAPLVALLSGVNDADAVPKGPVEVRVVITTDPRGAKLAVNGAAQGEAPLRTKFVVGRPVIVTAKYPGYEPLRQTLTATKEQEPVRLSLVPRDFFVKVVTRPRGATVEAVGQSCVSPCELPLGFVDGVVSVSIRKKNYRRTSRPVRPEQFTDRKGRLEAGIVVELSALPKNR